MNKKPKIVRNEPQIKLSMKEKAQLMMFKMGWKGEGLGKNEQGRRTPLMVKRTSETQGIIYTEASEAVIAMKPTVVLEITNILCEADLTVENIEELTNELQRITEIIV